MTALRRWTLLLNVAVFLAGFNLLATATILDAKTAPFPLLLVLAPAFTVLAVIFGVSSSGSVFEIGVRSLALTLDATLLLVATRLGTKVARDAVFWVISLEGVTGGVATLLGIFLFASSVVSLLALLIGGES